jgi:predicted transcriptional regulator
MGGERKVSEVIGLAVAPRMAKSLIGPMSASRRDPPHRAETDADRQARLARKAEMIAEARAEVARGEVADIDEVVAWVQRWDIDHELPTPQTVPAR